ncbi:MAG: hypothetical protein JPMHGGIA_01558 [Saprospiraceae bacterium]|nr:hypothetical protein [Saprospiraceae bacterium]
MESIQFPITTQIRGASALRLFELGKRDTSQEFIVPLYNEGVSHAYEIKKSELLVSILRFVVSVCSENSKEFHKLGNLMSSEKIPQQLVSESIKSDSALFRALGECFYLFPVHSNIDTIIALWNNNKQSVSSISNVQKSDKKLETAWGPMLAALGACAATDKNYKNLTEDEETEQKLNPLYQARAELIEERQPLFEVYKEVYRKFEELENTNSYRGSFIQRLPHIVWNNQVITVSDFNNFVTRIKSIDEKINRLTNEIDKLENHLSAGNLLMKISSNAQRFHGYLRQYAVIGLMKLQNSPFLDDKTRERIAEHLNKLFEITKNEKQFRTFEIRIAPDATFGELLHLFKMGIHFLTEQWIEQQYVELPNVLKGLMNEIPNVFDFLSKYPLRLVLPEDKYKFYGVYSASRYDLERWTRFQGELYIGEVQERYFELDDLTRPNSMGISVFTLQNLFVALPTLWHEYQHYGEEGIKKGNDNEMSVYTLENIFLRRQIMEYAKKLNISQNNSTITEILFKIQNDDPGAYLLLSFDFFQPYSYQNLLKIIQTNYPDRQLPLEVAKIKAGLRIKAEDDNTIEANFNNFFWHPEIRWPLLNESNSEIYNKLYSILIKTFTQVNVLSYDEWNNLLNAPSVKSTLNEWEVFVKHHRLNEHFIVNPPIFSLDENVATWLNRI